MITTTTMTTEATEAGETPTSKHINAWFTVGTKTGQLDLNKL